MTEDNLPTDQELSALPQKEADYAQMLAEFFERPTLVPKDFRVDDGAAPKKPNFFRFATDADGLDIEPYPVQALTMSELYNEVCPRCSNPRYRSDPKVKDPEYRAFRKNVRLLEHGVCPNCGLTRSQMVLKGLEPLRTTAAFSWGQRSGKSAAGAMGFAYHTHQLLKLQQPARVYGISPVQVLQGSITAISMSQAMETTWAPLQGYFADSPWFRSYLDILREVHTRTGDEQFKFMDTFIAFKHRRIEIRVQSPSVKTLRGRTRFCSLIDEIAWLDLDIENSGSKIKANARGVYEALDRSLLTVRAAQLNLLKQGYNDVPTGVMYCISSIADRRDMIMHLMNAAKVSPSILASQRATWEVNPTVGRDDPVIVEAYARNPVTAARDYGSVPPVADNAFFARFSRVLPAFSGKANSIQYQYKRRRQVDGSYTRVLANVRVRRGHHPSILAFDAAYKSDSFAFACGHLDDEGNPVIDLVGEVIPRNDCPVNFRSVLDECFAKVFDSRHVQLVVSDRWQNIKMMQDIQEDYGITTVEHRLKYSEILAVRERIWDGQVTFPSLDFDPDRVMDQADEDYPNCFDGQPMPHLVFQMMTVRDTGTDVAKGTRVTDDIWRCCALLVRFLTDRDIQQEFLTEIEEGRGSSPVALGSASLMSQSGGPRSAGSREVVDAEQRVLGYVRGLQ